MTAPITVESASNTEGSEPAETQAATDAADVALVESSVLVEEISIDGMCGVY